MSLDAGPTTVELIERYRRDGFVELPELLDSKQVAAIEQHLDRIVCEVVPRMEPGDYVLESDGGAVRNLWRLEHYDPFFAALGNDPRLLGLAGQLLGGEAVLAAVETFNKPACQGSAVPPHQDNAYFCQEPPDMLTVWVAIDATTVANGPVNFLSESKDILLPHKGSGIPGNSMVLVEPPAYDPSRVRTGLLRPGDATVHHCQTIHWSEPNRTELPRRGMLLVYRADHTRTSPELHQKYQAAAAAYAASQPTDQPT